jgi:serine/threonine protein phosphatase PrpC
MEQPFYLEAGNATAIGTKYPVNQDSHKLDSERGIFMVADGVGGGPAGEVASRVAVHAAFEYLSRNTEKLNLLPAAEILENAIQKSQNALLKVMDQVPAYQGMGTTLLIAWFPANHHRLWLGHVGDCRGYLSRRGQLILLTRDHTVFNAVRDANQLPEDPSRWPPRHLLSQALGSSYSVSPQIVERTVQPGDLYLLCSDGVYRAFELEELKEMLARPMHAQTLCETLIDSALKAGADDNLTAVAVRVRGLISAKDTLTAVKAMMVEGT